MFFLLIIRPIFIRAFQNIYLLILFTLGLINIVEIYHPNNIERRCYKYKWKT